jgi:hypothetical protein
MVCINLRKADDSVPLNKIWQVIEEQRVKKQYIWGVKNLNTNMTSSIKVGQRVFQKFHTTKGQRLGC